MLCNVTGLTGFAIAASDGDIGVVDDIYFDDEKWGIRYLVIDTGSWLRDRKVLIAPMSVATVNWDEKTIQVNLTQQQVKDSPDFDTDKPVSRQHETEFHHHYGFPFYWNEALAGAPMVFPTVIEIPASERSSEDVKVRKEHELTKADQHLRSAKDVEGYAIQVRDDVIGHVEDFLFDTNNWTIQLIVIDPRDWWPGKHVLVSPQRVEAVSWAERKLFISLSREELEQSPEYDPGNPPSGQQTGSLYRHANQPPPRVW